MLVMIRDINTGAVVTGQQISDDSGRIQQDALAARLIDEQGLDSQDVYCAVQQGDVALQEFQF